MSILASNATPIFGAYVFPIIVSVALSGVALASIGIGIMVVRAAVHP